MKLLVGIDVSSKSLEVAMMTSEDIKTVFQGSFYNDLDGACELKQKILTLHQEIPFDHVVIGMESTSIYSFHPALFFQNDDDLAQFNTESVVLNPRDTKRYKDVYEESKTDRIDAFYIADYLRVGRYSVSVVRQEKYVALQRLTRSRFELVESLARAKKHFVENLYYKLNKLVIGTKTNFFSVTMISLLEELTTEELIALSTEDLIDYLVKKGHGRFAEPEELARTIKKAVNSSYRLSKVVQDSIDAILVIYAKEIRTYQKLIKTLNQEIEKLMSLIPEHQILQSIPGIGPVYGTGIIAEIGQVDRFENEAKLAKYAGLAWKKNQSGKFDGQKTPRVHTGNTYLRYYLVEAANSIIRYDPVFKAYFDKKDAEIKGAPRKRALSLTARKLIRVIFNLLENHQIYIREEVV